MALLASAMGAALSTQESEATRVINLNKAREEKKKRKETKMKKIRNLKKKVEHRKMKEKEALKEVEKLVAQARAVKKV